MFGYFDYEALNQKVLTWSEQYNLADPFPHISIDQFADDRKLHNVLQDFPKPGDLKWWSYDNNFEKKLAFDKVHELHYSIKHILCEMNSAPFLEFLEKLTGIQGLVSDPHYIGGGLHQIPGPSPGKAGGKLDIHADFNWHKRLQLDRRLNVILYLNKFWLDEYGGHLELWDEKMTACQKKILPVFNRMVCFNTTDFSYHGHPHPLSCPEGTTRKSLALYYYSNGRPDHEKTTAHSTLYKRLPSEAVDPRIEELRSRRARGERF